MNSNFILVSEKMSMSHDWVTPMIITAMTVDGTQHKEVV